MIAWYDDTSIIFNKTCNIKNCSVVSLGPTIQGALTLLFKCQMRCISMLNML